MLHNTEDQHSVLQQQPSESQSWSSWFQQKPKYSQFSIQNEVHTPSKLAMTAGRLAVALDCFIVSMDKATN